jgi:tRNA dimethylallyltransferase
MRNDTKDMSTPYTQSNPPVIAILGATATGKTAIAIDAAQKYNGEIVSIDSRYLYRGLDIGTAKPTPRERAEVTHHLIDILDPGDDYSLALYQRDAYAAINDILERNRLPVLAGGSPLYVRAVIEGWRIPEAAPDPVFRQQMQNFVDEHGSDALHQRLAEIDPGAAERTPQQNVRRVIRALEIHHRTGQRMSDLEGKEPPPWDILRIGLHIEREQLFERIDRRVDQMLEQGLVDEVRGLLDAGVSPDCTAMRSIGYQEVVPFLREEYDYREMVERIKFATHRYVRHQLTWLRKTPGIHWVDALTPDFQTRIYDLIENHIQK